jgi:hypothetical protein
MEDCICITSDDAEDFYSYMDACESYQIPCDVKQVAAGMGILREPPPSQPPTKRQKFIKELNDPVEEDPFEAVVEWLTLNENRIFFPDEPARLENMDEVLDQLPELNMNATAPYKRTLSTKEIEMRVRACANDIDAYQKLDELFNVLHPEFDEWDAYEAMRKRTEIIFSYRRLLTH